MFFLCFSQHGMRKRVWFSFNSQGDIIMTSRKFAARWSWLTLIGIVLLGMAPGANRSLRGQEAAKGLALGPSNALALLHLRPAALSDGPVGRAIRPQLPEHVTNPQRTASMTPAPP